MVVDPGYIIHVVELAFTFSWLDPFAKLSRKLGGFFLANRFARLCIRRKVGNADQTKPASMP